MQPSYFYQHLLTILLYFPFMDWQDSARSHLSIVCDKFYNLRVFKFFLQRMVKGYSRLRYVKLRTYFDHNSFFNLQAIYDLSEFCGLYLIFLS